jgi:hypothetical protein
MARVIGVVDRELVHVVARGGAAFLVHDPAVVVVAVPPLADVGPHHRGALAVGRVGVRLGGLGRAVGLDEVAADEAAGDDDLALHAGRTTTAAAGHRVEQRLGGLALDDPIGDRVGVALVGIAGLADATLSCTPACCWTTCAASCAAVSGWLANATRSPVA